MKNYYKFFQGLFFAVLFNSFAFTLSFKQEPKRHVASLEKKLLKVHLPAVEKVLGEKLLASRKPVGFIYEQRLWRRFIVKRNFYHKLDVISNFILLLEENKAETACAACLDVINEIFYFQFRRFILSLKSVNTKEKEAFLSVLFNIYECQNIGKENLEYSYEPIPLGMLFTNAIISVFKVRSSNWSYKEKRDFLTQYFTEFKINVLEVFKKLSAGQNLVRFLSEEKISDFIDALNNVALGKVHSFLFRRICKWFLGTVVVIGGIYGLYLLINEINDSSVSVVKSSKEVNRRVGNCLGIPNDNLDEVGGDDEILSASDVQRIIDGLDPKESEHDSVAGSSLSRTISVEQLSEVSSDDYGSEKDDDFEHREESGSSSWMSAIGGWASGLKNVVTFGWLRKK